MRVETLRPGAEFPGPEEVAQLYALASSGPPLFESADVAAMLATLYDLSLDREDLLVVEARKAGELIGFGYGHPWRWAEQTDEWSAALKAGLGGAAAELDDAFAVQLVAVHPAHVRQGLGFELLKRIMIGSAARVHWVQATDVDSPATRLFRRMGYRRLGPGPQAPNGAPGIVLSHG
ncbi:MAG: GNAT family N-acetyltransferase [Propionicimonas sp.]